MAFFSLQGRSGLADSHGTRGFPRKSFIQTHWMDEDTVDSADTTSASLFFSKVSSDRLLSCHQFPKTGVTFVSSYLTFSRPAVLDVQVDAEMYSMADDVFESPPMSASPASTKKFPSLWVSSRIQRNLNQTFSGQGQLTWNWPPNLKLPQQYQQHFNRHKLKLKS